MHRPSRTELLFALVVVAVVIAATAVYLTSRDSGANTAGVVSDVQQPISTNGAKLAAEVVTPQRSGPSPLVVMPAGWGGAPTQYRPIARQLAASGYVVVAYAQRGFSPSTGAVDFAGTATQHDASVVISWALDHTHADPAHIGMMGMSYGAGVSLLAAAHDRRVRAVVALSTWADVGQAYSPGNTPSTAALSLFIGGAKPSFPFDATVTRLRRTLASDPQSIGRAVRAISGPRSPATYVSELNKNGPAIMLANGFEDSVFPPAQLIPFFDSLTTPKRLELAKGDHGGPELSSLYGQPNSTVDDARAWLDHFLLGSHNGIESEAPIVLHDVKTDIPHSYARWPLAAAGQRVPLGEPGSAVQTGKGAVATWQASIRSGTDSTAVSGPTRLVPSAAYAPPQLSMSTVQASKAFIWKGPQLVADFPIIGVPTVNLLLGSSARTATIYVYVYDVSPNDVGSLVDVQPYTKTNLVSSPIRPITVAMQPMAWTVPRGDHVEIVVDTVDQRFHSLTPSGATTTVASDTSHPAAFIAGKA